jgi:hypothetical protein
MVKTRKSRLALNWPWTSCECVLSWPVGREGALLEQVSSNS